MSKPYFELKDVILARSGIQVYTYQELIDYGMPEPAVKKDYYLEYRPAGVLIKALEMFKMLPLAQEHPPEDINSANFPYYAKGYTGSEVTVVPMEDGEIGLKSSLVFSTSDIYDYYKKGNKEVSVGYRAKKKWVEGEKYDVLLEEITSVNHLAVTAAGRGGSSVSVIDSLIGGIKMARTGYVAYLSRLGVQQDSVAPFSTTVFNALESLKGDNVEKALKPVFDSMGAIKEGAGKEQLKDIIRDMFDNKDLVMDKREESIKILDSIYEKSISDSISEMKSVVDACSDKKEDEPKKTEDEPKKTEDSETKKEEPKKEEPKKEEPKKEEPKKEDKKTEDTDGKGKNTNNIMDSLEPMIKEVVEKSIKSFLNIKETKVQDSSVKSQEATFDDISFMF